LGNSERFVTALIGSPFGLGGRVKIESLSGEQSHLLELQKVVLRKGKEEKEYTIEEVFSSPLSIKFKGIDSLEAAKALNSAEILVSRKEAVPLNKEEYYIEDLRGIKVYSGTQKIGIITDLFEGGGGFLAEILLETGEKKLVPFRNEFFGDINPIAGQTELLNLWILE